MQKETADAIAVALWALGLVPAVLVLQWFGAISSGWGAFFMAYVVLAALTLSFEFFQRWIRRLLYGPADGEMPPPPPRP